MPVYQHDYAGQILRNYCLRVNPDHTFSIFAIQTKKAKRWFGLDCSDPNNPVTSVISPADALGDFASYEIAEEVKNRANVLRNEYLDNLERLTRKASSQV